jgi:exosortase
MSVASVTLASAASGRWWRCAVGIGAVVAVYAPIFPMLAWEWATFPNLSHGFAIPVIAAYLLWTRRDTLAAVPLAPDWTGLGVAAFGLTIYVVATLGSEPFLARLSFPVTLLGASLLLAGRAATREALPAIGYLLFMMPLPYLTLRSLTDDARLFDATMTGTILSWLGIPIFRDGFILTLPNATLEVADVCSSIPAIASLLALAGAYGLIRRRSRGIVVILLLAAVPLGIASNIVRIMLTAAGVYYIGPVVLQSVIHTWHGTMVFLMTFGALLALEAALARRWGN